MSYFFFLYQSLPLSLCTLFDSVSSNIGKVLSINLSANVFVFGDSRSVELCYNFSFSNDLSQMVNFPTLIPDCDSPSPALLELFLSSDASICSTMAFPPLGNSGHIFVPVFIAFPSYSQRNAPFHRIPYDYSRAD